MKICKKIICSFLVVLMLLTSAPLQGFVGVDLFDWFSIKSEAASAFADYVEISDVDGLKAMKNNLGAKYILTSDIDLSSISWVPIGTQSAPFSGIFDGNGYTISGLNIRTSLTGGSFVGLFGFANGANITNVNLYNVTIEIVGSKSSEAFYSVGTLCGRIYNTTVSECSASGTVKCSAADGNYVRVGGIVGETYSSSSIYDCASDCYLVGEATSMNCMVGGITAWLESSSVYRCLFSGAIVGGTSSTCVYTGGIVGSGLGDVNNCAVLATSLQNNGDVCFSGYVAYYDTTNNVVLQGISGNVSGLNGTDNKNITDTQATNKSTYTLLGWDFDKIWKISGDCPALRHKRVVDLDKGAYYVEFRGTVTDSETNYEIFDVAVHCISNTGKETLTYLTVDYDKVNTVSTGDVAIASGWVPFMPVAYSVSIKTKGSIFIEPILRIENFHIAILDEYSGTYKQLTSIQHASFDKNGMYYTFEVDTAEVGGYSATAAVEYARRYALSYNKEWYFYYNGGDCANFVSQALYAGGMPMTDEWHCYDNNTYAFIKNGNDTNDKCTWIRAQELCDYLVAQGGTLIHNPKPTDFSLGDAVFYDWDGGRIDHSAIVTAIDNGVPKVSAHTTNEKYSVLDGHWTYGYDSSHCYLVKLNGNICSNGDAYSYDVYQTLRDTKTNNIKVTDSILGYDHDGIQNGELFEIVISGYNFKHNTSYLGDVKATPVPWTVRFVETGTIEFNYVVLSGEMNYGYMNYLGDGVIVNLDNFEKIGHWDKIEVSHSYSKWKILSSPTCTSVGVRERKCSKCSYYEREIIDKVAHNPTKATCINHSYCKSCGKFMSSALGHNWDSGVVTKAPTCIETGVKTYNCTRCSASKTETLELVDHTWGEYVRTQDPTCTRFGFDTGSCSVCQKTRSNIILPLGHDIAVTVVNPTCTEQGYTINDCQRANCSYCATTDYVEATGHSLSPNDEGYETGDDKMELISSVANVCGNGTVDKYQCTHINKGVRCTYAVTIGESNDHDMRGWYEETAATCTETGLLVNACINENCTYRETEIIPALGHDATDWTDNGDGTHIKECKRDNCDFGESEDCSYGEWNVSVEPTCTEKGEQEKFCEVCNHRVTEEIEELDHKWGVWSDNADDKTHIRVCENDNNHVEIREHNLNDGNLAVVPTCETSGEIEYLCVTCNAKVIEEVEPTGHNYVYNEELSYPATCTENGRDYYVCENNAEHTRYDELSAYDHNLSDWTDTPPEPCGEGRKRRECTNEGCEYFEEESYFVDHSFGDEVVVPGTCCTLSYKYKICEKCQYEELYGFGDADPDNHADYGKETYDIVNETCTTDGYTGDLCCLGCFAVLEPGEVVVAPGHAFGAWTSSPSADCVNAGHESRICKRCDLLEERDIEAKGHRETFSVGDIIEIGSYPQTRVVDEELVAELEALITDDDYVAYDTFSGDGTVGSMEKSELVYYADVELNGEKYRKVKIVNSKPLTTIAPLYENHYLDSIGVNAKLYSYNSYSSINGYLPEAFIAETMGLTLTHKNEKVYWFKYEPVKWSVLDSDSGTLISDIIIDAVPYSNTVYADIDKGDPNDEESYSGSYYSDEEKSYLANDYKSSFIRQWLNSDFINTAFTEEEKARLIAIDEDKIILPSYDSLTDENNGFEPSGTRDENRQANSSDYAQSQGVLGILGEYTYKIIDISVSVNKLTNVETVNRYWLRDSVDEKGLYVKVSDFFGNVNDSDYAKETVVDYGVGVRPVISIEFPEYSDEEDKAPSCTEDGYYGEEYCGVCGEITKERETIPATGHNWDNGVIDPESTCKDHGTKTYTCQNDSSHKKTEAVELNPDNHVGETYIKDAKTETCTVDGYTGDKHCSDCDVLLESGEAIAKLGHDMSKWSDNNNGSHTRDCQRNGCTYTETDDCIFGDWVVTKEATCTEKGSKERICTICGYKETAEIELKDHIPGETVIENEVAPKCEEKGSYDEVVYCTECSEELSREEKEIPETGHNWDNGVIDPESTCKDHGTKTYTCQNDISHKKTEAVELNPDNHVGETYIKDAKTETCTADGYTGDKYCSDCDALLEKGEAIDKLGHHMSEWSDNNNGSHTRECQRKGCTYTETDDCTFGDWIVTKEATCTEKGSKERICTICGYKETAEIEFKDHIPGEAVIENRIEPKCEEKGSYDEVVYCTGCPKELSRVKKDIDPLGHDWGEWMVSKDATIDANGEEKRICKRNSSHIETRETEKLISYTAYFIKANENGAFEYNGKMYDLVDAVIFAEGTTVIVNPDVPEEEGFIGYWEDYTLSDENIYIEAVYELKSSDNQSELKSDKDVVYKDGVATITLSAFAETLNAKVPMGATPCDIILVLDQSSSMTSYKIGKETRLAVLKRVAKDFVTTVYDSAVENEVDHRVALVSFSGTKDNYKGTGIIGVDGKIKTFKNLKDSDYANAFIDVNGNLDNLKTGIDSLTGISGTSSDYGLQMARQILANNQDGREKLVLFITDGEPGDPGRNMGAFNYTVANDAIDYANQIKNDYGTTIYSIGVAAGADPGDESDKINKFLHYVSSNYPDAKSMDNKGTAATMKNYFLSAEDADEIEKMFESIVSRQIVNTISFTKVNFYDTVSEYFTLTTENENALRETVKAEYGVSDSDIIITRNADGTTTVRINNLIPKAVFDDNNVQIGYGATVKFDVTANEKTLEGGTFVTNTEDAGIENGGKTVIEFKVPDGETISSGRAIVEFRIGDEVYAIREVSIGDKVIVPETDVADWVVTDGATVTSDYTVFNTEYTSETRTVKWIIDGEVKEEAYHIGEIIFAPDFDIPEGKLFKGWSEKVPYRMPDYDLEFTAVFEAHEHSYNQKSKTGECTTGIIYTYACDCGDTYTETEKYDNHSYTANVQLVNDESVATMTCTVCGKADSKVINYVAQYETGGRLNKTKVVDMTLYDNDGITVQPNGYVYVKIHEEGDVLSNAKSGKLIIKRVNEDGSEDNIPYLNDSSVDKAGYYVDGNYIVLKLDHFSYYALIMPEDAADVPTYDEIECAFNGHSYTSKVTAPTCTSKGFTTHTCTKCSDSYIDNEVGALGHIMGAYTMTVNPSCTDKGTQTATCTRCKTYTETKSVDATGHNYKDNVCVNCGNNKAENCSHMCHKSGFMSFIWKILCFFFKLFKTQPVCECGAKHY